jgi:2-methylcitrate dehydratase PrpD
MFDEGAMKQSDLKQIDCALRKQAAWAENLKYEDLDPSIVKQSRRQILDALGVIVTGLNEVDINAVPSEPGESILFGTDRKVTKQWATILHGGVMCSIEMDEGNWFSLGHPACHFMPALLTEAEHISRSQDITMKKLIAALVGAYEITCRWQGAITTHPQMHAHGTMGTLGGAIAFGKLHDLSRENLYQAMILANSLPLASVWESSLQGDTVRNLYLGLANFIGISAHDFYRMGYKSSAATCTSVWTNVLGIKQNYPYLTGGLGTDYYIEKCYYKRYSSCRWVHPAADIISSLQLTKEQINKIERIDLYTVEGGDTMKRQEVTNAFQARFSTPIALATLLMRGNLDWTTVNNETVQEPDIKAMAKKIFVHNDPVYHNMPDEVRWDRLEISIDGQTKIYKKNGCEGDWDKPFSDDILFEKFKKLTRFSWNAERQDKIIDMIMHTPAEDSAVPLFRVLSK